MAFNVNEFRSQLVGDGARPNLFEVTMTMPGFVGGGVAASTKLTFMCKSAAIPGSTVGVASAFYFGRELKFAGNRSFSDWPITIINDEDYIVRKAFEQWSWGINEHTPNLRLPNAIQPSQYQVDAFVKQFGKRGDTIRTYKLIGSFPTDISPIDLDWGSNDTIEEYTVTMAYSWWTTGDLA